MFQLYKKMDIGWCVGFSHSEAQSSLYLPLKLPKLCFYSSRTLGFWVKSFTLIKPSGPILFGKKYISGVNSFNNLKKENKGLAL